MRGAVRVVLTAALAAAAPAHSAQVCAWLIETRDPAENFHEVALWLQADQDADIYYMIKGEGLKEDDGGRSHSPSRGTFILHRNKAEKPWGFGATLYPPGEVDIVAEVHAWPADIFSDDEPPLLAAFPFHRKVPEGEETPPTDLAQKQCQSVTIPAH